MLDETLELFDFAWQRLLDRMDGLGDAEWAWTPSPDEPRVSVRWRLDHIAEVLGEQRNARWLGRDPVAADPEPADSAAAALTAATGAYADWRAHLSAMDDAALAEPVGPVGGPFAESSRGSFALHIADELIHHGAEAALLRDLYRVLGGT